MSVTFVAWRASAYDTPVRTLPSRSPGRYNRAFDPPTQYFSLHPWGPWAEVLRWENRRTPDEAGDLRMRIWTARLALNGVVEELAFDSAGTAGVAAESLVSEDYAACQDYAGDARARGVEALVVPSAALPGTRNLVVLGPRVVAPWTPAAIDDIDVPAAVAADRAGPPLALLAEVRWRLEPHAELVAWQAGDAFTLDEHVPTPL